MGIEQGSSLLVEGRCTQNRLQLLPAPPGVLSGTARNTGTRAGFLRYFIKYWNFSSILMKYWNFSSILTNKNAPRGENGRNKGARPGAPRLTKSDPRAP